MNEPTLRLVSLLAWPAPVQPQPIYRGPMPATVTATGLTIEDTSLGDGAVAVSGHTVNVHYSGWLAGGRKFGSSRERNQPLEFEIDAGQVVAGWDEGVQGMKVGGRRRLTIPPHLGYGADGSGQAIPPNATLVIDVELLSVA